MQNNTFFEDSCPNKVIVLEETTSTNDYLKDLLTNFKPLPQYTAIMAKKQTAGKGQRGNTWLSQPSLNLTASFLLNPINLSIQDQFLLTMISSLAVRDVIAYHTQKTCLIKWPNDIMIDGKKIAGILIENKISKSYIKHSIIGIGINIYQTNFPETINHKTTSVKLQNEYVNVEMLNIVNEIQQNLSRYQDICQKDTLKLIELYNNYLFRKNEKHNYIIDSKEVEGVIKKIEKDGLLQITVKNTVTKVDLKGITYIL